MFFEGAEAEEEEEKEEEEEEEEEEAGAAAAGGAAAAPLPPTEAALAASACGAAAAAGLGFSQMRLWNFQSSFWHAGPQYTTRSHRRQRFLASFLQAPQRVLSGAGALSGGGGVMSCMLGKGSGMSIAKVERFSATWND